MRKTKPETVADRLEYERQLREHPELVPTNTPPSKRYTREELEKINNAPLKLRPRSKWNWCPC